MKKLVIIGGDAAGMSAAMQVVRRSDEYTITVLEQGEHYSYGQCGLPYTLSGIVESTDDVIARPREVFAEKYDIDARAYYRVEQVDPKSKRVSGTHLTSGEAFEESYDTLLIASGASPIMPPWQNNHLDGIHVMKTIVDTDRILNDLTTDVRHVTVIGGGYIGLEVAENVRESGRDVRIIQKGPKLAPIFDGDLAEHVLGASKDNGLDVHLEESVTGFEGDQRVNKVTTDRGSYETDLVIVAVGIKPNTSFVNPNDFNLHDGGAIVVNEYQETGVQDVYAAGDCATQYHRIKETDDYIPLGTHANKQGAKAGQNIASPRSQTYKGMVGSSIIKYFDLHLGKTGLNETECQQAGLDYHVLTHETLAQAGYYSKENKLTMKMTYEADTNRVLGLQVIGTAGVDKRIDVIATALYHRMTADDLLELDLSYAPPFNGVYDPVQQMARRITKK